ncbi:MAG: secretin N-terminal domain-containing protein [Candidatus Marinimicrobia bacterium]|nr:secretin N-terminal domain-containing protein [Candidatus Neomarinimicrobiota bacterium]
MDRKFNGLILLLVLAFSLPISAQESVRVGEPTTTVSLNLKDVSITNVLKTLEAKTGIKFVVDPSIQDRRITVILNEVSAEDAISVVMESNGLGYRKIEGVDVYMVSDLSKIMRQTVVRKIVCQYSEAAKLQEILKNIVTPSVGAVIADARTNSLIIRDNPEALTMIEGIIKDLDRPTPQIFIQAAIAEIALTKNNETGAEFLWKDPNILSSGDKVASKFDLRQSTTSEGTGSTQYLDGSGNAWSQALPKGIGLGVGILNSHIDVVLHALQTDYDLNVLSRPYLVTLDNQEAEIEVGDQIPYKVLNQYGITSYEFKSATVRLIVKPHVNNDQTITIDLRPNADYQNGSTPDGVPIIATRKAETRVKVGNGKTIVIGGLMRESETKTVSKIPIFGSIPLIGSLFRSTIHQKLKTELVVFITPIIVTSEMEINELQPQERLSDDAFKRFQKFDSEKENKK